ncbi:MAG: thioredoxin domain-containing protein [Chitinispirillaceae bacterium]|nr:thioredoxin domain-containing protein [Chitinispirillaceae bacterium]
MRYFFCSLIVVCCACGSYGCYCDSLDTAGREILLKVQRTFLLPVCGDATLEERMHDPSSCALGPRLSEFACWLTGSGRDSAFIAEKLFERCKSLTSERRYDIDCSLFEPAGDSAAPIVIGIYISIGCPWCKQVCDYLYDSVTAGSLKGKARLCVKLLSASDRDMALLAANECGVFWKYMQRLAAIEERLDENVLYNAADGMGIRLRRFKAAMRNKKLRERAMASRKEGLDNGVKGTPTLFINGRRYDSYNHPAWIMDAVDYEYRRTAAGPERSPK